MASLEIKEDFPIFTVEKDLIYFDSASTTLVPKVAIDAMHRFLAYTTSSSRRGAHHLAVKGGTLVEGVRKTISQIMETNANQISFQPSIPSAVVSLVLGMDWTQKDSIIVSQGEENSILVALQRAAQILDVKLVTLPINENGETEVSELEKAINSKTGLVSISEITMGIGGVNKIDELSSIAHDFDSLFLSDIRQSVAFHEKPSTSLGADILLFSANIGLMGPPGLAIQWIDQSIGSSITPGILGGSSVSNVTANNHEVALQPDKFESGTLNIPAIVGLGAAVEYLSSLKEQGMINHLQQLARTLINRLSQITNVNLYGNPSETSTIFGINIGSETDAINCHDIALFLDESNIAVRSGLLCSHPLISQISADGIVQISIHAYNTLDDIEHLTNTLQMISADLV